MKPSCNLDTTQMQFGCHLDATWMQLRWDRVVTQMQLLGFKLKMRNLDATFGVEVKIEELTHNFWT